MAYIKLDPDKEQLFLEVANKIMDKPEILNRRVSNSILKSFSIKGVYRKDNRYRVMFTYVADSLGGLKIKCEFAGNYEYFSASPMIGSNSSIILPNNNQSEWDKNVENSMKFLYKKAVLDFRPSVP